MGTDICHVQALSLAQVTNLQTRTPVVSDTVMSLEKLWQSVGPYEAAAHFERIPLCNLRRIEGIADAQITRKEGSSRSC